MVVLKGVPALLSPELLFALARMGHGDEIVLADVNFPTSSICRCGPEEIRADGLGIPQLLEAVLKLLPLDTYVESPAAVMELEPSDWERGLQTPVWRSYESILFMAGCTSTLAKIERFEFYERAKKAFAVVATGPGHTATERWDCHRPTPAPGPSDQGLLPTLSHCTPRSGQIPRCRHQPPTWIFQLLASVLAAAQGHTCTSQGGRAAVHMAPSGPGRMSLCPRAVVDGGTITWARSPGGGGKDGACSQPA
uniref:Fucose mutarotase n=1 Tax=Equus caballus TaxID=9796 RepID=A0A9L0R061_HORSE